MKGMKIEPVSIEACFGDKGCPNSLGNVNSLIVQLKKIVEEEKVADFILEKTNGRLKQHNTFRIGISNCPNACSQIHIKDFGIIQKVKIKIDKSSCVLCGKCANVCIENAIKIENNSMLYNKSNCIGCGMCVKVCNTKSIEIEDKGFSVYVGGKLGRHPMLALKVEDFVKEEKVVEIFKKVIKFYKENCIKGERLGSIIQRMQKMGGKLNFV